uniref:DDE-1 domain-containing protein n=1 Tax=Peronospora matthiolae TaxID=2874970 RepID=A0AAV1T6X3_9STRA
MDAGIICNFELMYKAQLVQWLLDMVTAGMEDKKLDVLSTIRMVVKSWAEKTIWSVKTAWKNGNQTPMQLPPLSHFRVMTTATETKIPSSLIATR